MIEKFKNTKKTILITFSFLLFLNIGCSVLKKSFYLKQINKNNSWKIVKNKNSYSFWKTNKQYWSSRHYYSCDSISILYLDFSDIFFKRNPALSFGPPFVPIIPNFIFYKPLKDLDFDIQLNIYTDNIDNINSLTKHINFFFNDSLELFPMETKLKENNDIKDDYDVCDKSLVNKAYTLKFTFKHKSFKLKKIEIKFDNEFNTQLHADYKSIVLKKKIKLNYYPLLFPKLLF